MSQTATPLRSPFKFLDAYDREDRAIFFGRDKEIENLFELVRLSKLVLVYGLSGTGKTSLVNCGLANKFSENKWFPIPVRRGDHLPNAIYRELSRHASEPIPRTLPLPEAVEALYLEHFVPVYLIFDQFEELFILGSPAEQKEFFDSLAELFRSKVACRTIIVLREEYLAWFSDFEKTLPVLFDNRFRVERMNQSRLEEVVFGTITAPRFGIGLAEPQQTVADILENLRDARREIDLTNLQVYLDRLWQKGQEIREIGKLEGGKFPISQFPNSEFPALVFDPALVEQVGKLENVLAQFLDEQLAEVVALLKADEKLSGIRSAKSDIETVPLEILSAFVTDEETKQNFNLHLLQLRLKYEKGISPADTAFCVEEFLERRLLRRLRIGDNTVLELGHDLLASAIFDRFSIEEKARRKAKEVYAFYADIGKKRLFAKEELEILALYLTALPPEEELQRRMDESREAIRLEDEAELAEARRREEEALRQAEEERRLREQAELSRKYAELQKQQAELAQREAENHKQIAEAQKEKAEVLAKIAETQKQKAEAARQDAEINEQRAKKQRQLAIWVSLIALGLAAFATWLFFDAQNAKKRVINEKATSDTLRLIAQRQNETLLLEKQKSDSLYQLAQKQSDRLFLQKTESDHLRLQALENLRKYQIAEEKRQAADFSQLLNDAKVFMNSKDYDLALLRLEAAERLPLGKNDKQVKDLLAQCRRALEKKK